MKSIAGSSGTGEEIKGQFVPWRCWLYDQFQDGNREHSKVCPKHTWTSRNSEIMMKEIVLSEYTSSAGEICQCQWVLTSSLIAWIKDRTGSLPLATSKWSIMNLNWWYKSEALKRQASRAILQSVCWGSFWSISSSPTSNRMWRNSLETSSPTNVLSLVWLLVIAEVKSKSGCSNQVSIFRKTLARLDLSASLLGCCNDLGKY